jgi:hypothetical protein
VVKKTERHYVESTVLAPKVCQIFDISKSTAKKKKGQIINKQEKSNKITKLAHK